MAKLLAVDELTPHPRLGTTEILDALSDEEYAGLRASIASVGIKQPILISWPDKTIIDGHHRWRIAQELGLDDVPVMTEEFSSEARLLALGVEMNAARRQMTIERKRHAAAKLLIADPSQSDRSIAGIIGMSHHTVASVRRELEDGGQIAHQPERVGQDGVKQPVRPAPTGSRKDKAPSSWKPERAAKAEELVADLPEDERAATLSLVDEPGIPDVIGVEMVGNVAAMEPDQRKHVLDLHRSEDPRDKSKAKSIAADKPPMPDPRCLTLERAALEAKRAIQWCDRDPDPSFRQRIEAVVAELHALSDAIHEATRSDAA